MSRRSGKRPANVELKWYTRQGWHGFPRRHPCRFPSAQAQGIPLPVATYSVALTDAFRHPLQSYPVHSETRFLTLHALSPFPAIYSPSLRKHVPPLRSAPFRPGSTFRLCALLPFAREARSFFRSASFRREGAGRLPGCRRGVADCIADQSGTVNDPCLSQGDNIARKTLRLHRTGESALYKYS